LCKDSHDVLQNPSPRPDIKQLRAAALEHFRGGRLGEAEAAYRQVLAAEPQWVEPRIELGMVLDSQRRIPEAIEQYQQALAIQPNSPDAWNNLGVALRDAGRHEQARDAFSSALSLRRQFFEAMLNLGSLLQGLGRIEEAETWFGRAAALRPDNPVAQSALAGVLAQKEPAQTIEPLRRLVALQPDAAEPRLSLASALTNLGRTHEAIEQYRAAIVLWPQHAPAVHSLAVLLHQIGETEEAVEMYLRAAGLRPDFVRGMSELAVLLRLVGRREGSVEYHRRALALQPEPTLADNLLMLLLSDPAYDAQRLAPDLTEWNQRYGRPLAEAARPHARPGADQARRRLRVGFVSPYFDSRPVGRFLLPLLTEHDRAQFEMLCYSDVMRPDAMTARLRELAGGWRDITALGDEQLAGQIRGDTVDILIDLSMHARHNRLLVFARKPAPVQVTYLAYCGSTGLQTIDYRLSDRYLDPDDSDQKYYSERTVRLASYWCYPAPTEAPAVNPQPAAQAGHVTFGCLNDALKYNELTLATWLAILKALPDSRLIVHAPQKYDGRRIERQIAAGGVDPARVECVPMLHPAEYFRLHHRIDIALDPTPWPGGTTTCDALWMGVPVISVVGKTALSRGGLSILSNVGLPELVGRDCDEQTRIAIELARDLSRLTGLRSSLRERMRRSPLMDAPAFARDFEAVLRRMWESWCTGDVRVS
jgi:predicted O-linked N-acetylglucosamine transferase (SPINDLY family)